MIGEKMLATTCERSENRLVLLLTTNRFEVASGSPTGSDVNVSAPMMQFQTVGDEANFRARENQSRNNYGFVIFRLRNRRFPCMEIRTDPFFRSSSKAGRYL